MGGVDTRDIYLFSVYVTTVTLSDLAITAALMLARSLLEDWQHYKYDPDQSLFKSLKVIQEAGHEKRLKRSP